MSQAQKAIELDDGENTVKSVQPFGLRDKFGYLFGDFGGSFFFVLVNAYLMVLIFSPSDLLSTQ